MIFLPISRENYEYNNKKMDIAGCWKGATGHIFSKKLEMLFSERQGSRFLIYPNRLVSGLPGAVHFFPFVVFCSKRLPSNRSNHKQT